MRCTQNMGLSDEAEKFLEENCRLVPRESCPHCGGGIGEKKESCVYDEKTGVSEGMFEDGPLLEEYTLADGSKVKEVVQASPWSSGPCIFLCLEDENGNRIGEWPESSIENC